MTLLLPADQNVLKGIDRCIKAGRNVEAKHRKLGQPEQALTIEQFTARLEALRAEYMRHRDFNKTTLRGSYGGNNMQQEYDRETEHARDH